MDWTPARRSTTVGMLAVTFCPATVRNTSSTAGGVPSTTSSPLCVLVGGASIAPGEQGSGSSAIVTV
jgi:hypothetical protein